jgi:hypothetical protein
MKKTLIIAAAILLTVAGVYAQETQAPSPQNTQEIKDAKYTNESIARLSFVEGKVFVQRASDLGFEEGALNMPISEGDRIGTSEGRAEVHFGKGNYIRLDNETKVDVLNLPKKDDDVARIRVWSGNIYLTVGTLKKEKAIELHTADSSFYVLDRGIYRIDVRENKDTEIQVFQGLIEAAGEEGVPTARDLRGPVRFEAVELHRRRRRLLRQVQRIPRLRHRAGIRRPQASRGALRFRRRARRERRVDLSRPLRQRLDPQRGR